MSQAPNGLAGAFERHARRDPAVTALTVMGDGETETDEISFGDLHARALRLAATLVRRGMQGRPVLVMQSPGVTFAVGFWACLYAGAIATPAPAHGRGEGWRRLKAVAQDAGVEAILATSAEAALKAELAQVPWIMLDELEGGAAGEGLEAPILRSAGDPALLQYTSGSQSAPRGVLVSHGALAANLEMIRHGLWLHDQAVVFSWLPLFHDMGLIGAFLVAAYAGRPCVLAPALTFMQKPERWLKAISRHRATYSGAPNFAFELCARRAERMDLTGVDLSSWDSAFCGAEPVRAATMLRFAEAFAPLGFRAEALRPGYGLAEATLVISGGPRGGVRTRAARTPDAPPIVGCGAPVPGVSVQIVDPVTCLRCAEGEEGEIWAAGPSLADGYWRRPEETAAAFGARLEGSRLAYLRTGDLGFLSDGELFVTGRLKDVIIHRGENLHPADIEQAVGASHAGFAGVGAVFQLDDGGVVAVQEVERGTGADAGAPMVEAAVRAVAQGFGVRLHDLLLVRRRAIPLTTSGKVRRSACRELYLAETLKPTIRTGESRLLGRWATRST